MDCLVICRDACIVQEAEVQRDAVVYVVGARGGCVAAAFDGKGAIVFAEDGNGDGDI